MNDCILVAVPKVDRGPSDSINVVNVIVSQNEHKLHQLGTILGLIKGWYDFASVKLVESNFFKTENVN